MMKSEGCHMLLKKIAIKGKLIYRPKKKQYCTDDIYQKRTYVDIKGLYIYQFNEDLCVPDCLLFLDQFN